MNVNRHPEKAGKGHYKPQPDLSHCALAIENPGSLAGLLLRFGFLRLLPDLHIFVRLWLHTHESAHQPFGPIEFFGHETSRHLPGSGATSESARRCQTHDGGRPLRLQGLRSVVV